MGQRVIADFGFRIAEIKSRDRKSEGRIQEKGTKVRAIYPAGYWLLTTNY